MVQDFWYGPPSVETRYEFQLLHAVVAGHPYVVGMNGASTESNP